MNDKIVATFSENRADAGFMANPDGEYGVTDPLVKLVLRSSSTFS